MKTISFANQKGGSGKTSTTRAVATWLHYNTDLKIIVIDLDFQQTSKNGRDRDIEILADLRQSNPRHPKVMFFDEQELIKPIYPVYGIQNIANNKKTFIDLYERESKNYDLCFIDVAGSIKDKSIDAILPYINYMFIPTDVDFGTIQSSIEFATAIKSLFDNGGLPLLKDMRFFFHKYTVSKNKSAFEPVAEALTEVTSIPFFENQIKDANEMKMDNTTFHYIKGSLSADHYLYNFCMEIMDILENKYK